MSGKPKEDWGLQHQEVGIGEEEEAEQNPPKAFRTDSRGSVGAKGLNARRHSDKRQWGSTFVRGQC